MHEIGASEKESGSFRGPFQMARGSHSVRGRAPIKMNMALAGTRYALMFVWSTRFARLLPMRHFAVDFGTLACVQS